MIGGIGAKTKKWYQYPGIVVASSTLRVSYSQIHEDCATID